MGFSVCLVWSRPSHLRSMESYGRSQRKWTADFFILHINTEHFITSPCLCFSWWNFDRKCSPSFLPSRKTKTSSQTQHLSTGTRYLSPNDHWWGNEENFVFAFWGENLRIQLPSTSYPRDCIHQWCWSINLGGKDCVWERERWWSAGSKDILLSCLCSTMCWKSFVSNTTI